MIEDTKDTKGREVVQAVIALVVRAGWMSIGILLLALGFLASLIPIIPATPFVLLALICFVRVSPKLKRFLIKLLTMNGFFETLRKEVFKFPGGRKAVLFLSEIIEKLHEK